MTAVDKLRALLEAATPRPWQEAVDDHGRKGVDVGVWSPSAVQYVVETLVPGNDNARADAALIVAAVNALPELLDALEKCQGARDAAIRTTLRAGRSEDDVRRDVLREIARGLGPRAPLSLSEGAAWVRLDAWAARRLLDAAREVAGA